MDRIDGWIDRWLEKIITCTHIYGWMDRKINRFYRARGAARGREGERGREEERERERERERE